MPQETWDVLDREAERLGISTAELVRHACVAYVAMLAMLRQTPTETPD